jgi:hypothetical protein
MPATTESSSPASAPSDRALTIQDAQGNYYRLTQDVLDQAKMSDDDVEQFLKTTGTAAGAASASLAANVSGFVRTVPPSALMRMVPTALARWVPSGFLRMAPTSFARVVPTGMARAAPSPYARMAPTGLARAAPSPYARMTPTGLARAVPTGLDRRAPSGAVRMAPSSTMRMVPSAFMRATPTALDRRAPSTTVRMAPAAGPVVRSWSHGA